MQPEEKLGILEDGVPAYQALMSFLRECVDKEMKLRAFVVIGSRVRGHWKPWSDIDAVVVVDALPEDRLAPFLHAFKYGVEVRPYTPNEILDLARNGDVGALDALDHGIIVFEDGLWSKLRREFEAIREELGLERDEMGWVANTVEQAVLKGKKGLVN